MNQFSRVALAVLGTVFVGFASTVACVSNSTSNGIFSYEEAREKATRNETHTLALARGSTLRVDVPQGDVRVVATTAACTGDVKATITARGETVESARANLERVRLVIEPNDTGASLRVEPPREGTQPRFHARVDLRIDVPPGVVLQISSSSGDLSASGEAGSVHGASTLESSYGDVSIEGAEGDVVVATKSGGVAVRGVRRGSLKASSGYGDVVVADVEGTLVSAHSGSGEVSLDHVTCDDLKVDSNYGDVTLADVTSKAALEASSKSGDVRATRLAATHARLASGYGLVQVVEASGALSLKSQSGDVSARGVRSAVEAATSYGSVALEGVFTSLAASSNSGDVAVAAARESTLGAGWSLSSKYGDVSLTAPSDLGFELSARTGYGSIDVGYPLEVQPGSLSKDGKKVQGRVNGGGGSLKVETSNGDVVVKPTGP